MGCPECAHPLDEAVLQRPADNREVWTQQPGRHRDREVGLVVVGQRDHPLQVELSSPARRSSSGLLASAARPGTSERKAARSSASMRRFHIQHDESVICQVQAAGDDPSRLAETREDQERLTQSAHPPLEPLQTQCLLEPPVPQHQY